jgi:ethanolamine ammonia-lyase small subunit
MQHLRLKSRVLRQTCVDIHRSLVEDLASSNIFSRLLVGVGHFKHARHEVGDAVGTVALAKGGISLVTCIPGLDQSSTYAAYYCDQGHCRKRNARTMAPHELGPR